MQSWCEYMTDSIFEMKNLKKNLKWSSINNGIEYSSDNIYRAKSVVLMGWKRINYEFFNNNNEFIKTDDNILFSIGTLFIVIN